MKIQFTLVLLVLLVIGFISCKKGNSDSAISGKWQENRLRLYDLDSSNRILYDTTYLAPFTNLNYVQFNAGGTLTTSSDHYYYPNYLNYPTTPQAIPQSIGSLSYIKVGANVYVLGSLGQSLTPGGFDIADTAFVTGNTLRIHVVNYGHGTGNKGVSDAYYQR